jgi:hypothetical protein
MTFAAVAAPTNPVIVPRFRTELDRFMSPPFAT